MIKNKNKKPTGNVEISTFHIGDAVLGINIVTIQQKKCS